MIGTVFCAEPVHHAAAGKEAVMHVFFKINSVVILGRCCSRKEAVVHVFPSTVSMILANASSSCLPGITLFCKAGMCVFLK